MRDIITLIFTININYFWSKLYTWQRCELLVKFKLRLFVARLCAHKNRHRRRRDMCTARRESLKVHVGTQSRGARAICSPRRRASIIFESLAVTGADLVPSNIFYFSLSHSSGFVVVVRAPCVTVERERESEMCCGF